MTSSWCLCCLKTSATESAVTSLTLSQWVSSGNPVCLEPRPQCTLECHCPYPEPVYTGWSSVHWKATGMPLGDPANTCRVHWKTTGKNLVETAHTGSVPSMQINTGLSLEHHWALASASVVPVASQCTCGSSGLPVWSVQWYPSVLTKSGLGVIRSGHFPACDPFCIQLVWWELFELNWFHLTCNLKYTKNYTGANIKGVHRVMLKYSHVLRAELVSIAEQ